MIEPSSWDPAAPQLAIADADRPSIPELVARHAALTPDATAVVCAERVTTYRELQDAVDRLCARLRGLTAPGQRVAILLDRSESTIVALLAVLKSGNSYIPLDPNYPTERLAYVIADAAPSVVISEARLIGSLTLDSTQTLLLDRDTPSWIVEDPQPILDTPRFDPEAVAYVMYTSGTTGVPKGVQIRHRSLMNLLFAMKERPGLDARDVLLAVTTISFDIAALEIFLPLIVGARIVLAREADVIDGASLRQLLRQHNVTVLQATPATWQLLIAADWRDSRLKMLCGGEALSRHLAEQLLDRGGELWNMYGPTETTVWSSVLRVTRGAGPVLLGPPIANTYFRVLDESLRPVEPGDAGELFIGGEGVALGYVNLPELTAAKFVPDPFACEPTARLYRTGDIVRERRKNAVDCLEFLGRSDHQVKIRGYRIELGEIEATLLHNTAVAQAVAVGVRRGHEPMICAYVVLHSRETSLPESLLAEFRADLQRLLPSYMQPSSIVALAELPRTPNGKIDRAALPEPDASTLRPPTSRRAPGSEVERKLLAIWNGLLPHAVVDMDADFFALGGSSLLAAQLLNQIETQFDARLTLPALFGAPTIASQARLLGDLDRGDYDFRQVVRLHPSGAAPPLLVIHNTGVYSYRLAQLLGVDQPLVALQIFDPSRKSLPTTIEDIAAEYVQLIRHMQIDQPYRLIGWCIGGVLAYEIARQLRARNHTVTFLGMIDSWAPGHLQRQSRFRAWLTDRSFRIQLILTDWRKTREGQQSVLDFMRNRVVLKKLLRVAGDAHSQPLTKMFADRHKSGEHYDRWLAHYLEEVAERYEPRPYDGKIRLLRSSREPHGWMLDPLMGWERFAIGGMETEILDGDHFTVFRGVGLQQLANFLSLALAAEN